MARLNSLVIAGSIGAVLGSVFHPNILEIALVALVLVAFAHIIRSLKGKAPAASAQT